MARDRQRLHPDYLFFGEVVADWRKRVGLSQADVAKAGGPSPPTLQLIEAGTWSSGRPRLILEALDRAFDWEPGTAWAVLYDEFDPIAAANVGPLLKTPPGFVSGPGPEVQGGSTDRAVLDAVEAMRRDMQAMEQRLSERLEKLESKDS